MLSWIRFKPIEDIKLEAGQPCAISVDSATGQAQIWKGGVTAEITSGEVAAGVTTTSSTTAATVVTVESLTRELNALGINLGSLSGLLSLFGSVLPGLSALDPSKLTDGETGLLSKIVSDLTGALTAITKK